MDEVQRAFYRLSFEKAFLAVLSYFFERCDIFEDPSDER